MNLDKENRAKLEELVKKAVCEGVRQHEEYGKTTPSINLENRIVEQVMAAFSRITISATIEQKVCYTFPMNFSQ
ncbi:MAG: hypothetical protein HZA36_00790 [Parcubacteria group bacterium]|nr:hypothetical protein [Parcubacteria group bacterium]